MGDVLPFAPRGFHDVKVWKSLNREQRAWIVELLVADQLASDTREWVACGWAFELGRHLEEEREKSLRRRIFGL